MYPPARDVPRIWKSWVNRDGVPVHAPVFCPTRCTLSWPDHTDEIQHYPLEGSGYCYQALEVLRCVRLGLSESPQLPLTET